MRRTDLYTVDGQRVPSVTEILKLAGLVDFSRVDPAVLEAARERGSAVHEWLELVDQGFLPRDAEPDPLIAPYVAAYFRFRDECEFELAEGGVEQLVVNATYRYAGTMDRRGKIRGKPAVIDLKGVARVGAATQLQTCAYALCHDEPHERYALHLLADGTYRLIPYRDRQDVHDWLAAVRIVHWKLRHRMATIEEAA